MSEKISLVQGDTRPQLIFSVTDEKSGAPIDFSDAGTVVVMKFREVGAEMIKSTMVCGKLAGIVLEDGSIDYTAPYDVPGAGGRLYMNWAPDALDTNGEFEGEVEATFADGTIQSGWNILKFKVREQF